MYFASVYPNSALLLDAAGPAEPVPPPPAARTPLFDL